MAVGHHHRNQALIAGEALTNECFRALAADCANFMHVFLTMIQGDRGEVEAREAASSVYAGLYDLDLGACFGEKVGGTVKLALLLLRALNREKEPFILYRAVRE